MQAHDLRFLLWRCRLTCLLLTGLFIRSRLCFTHDAVCVVYQCLEIVDVVSETSALVVLDRGLQQLALSALLVEELLHVGAR